MLAGAALDQGEHARAIDLLGPLASRDADSARLLARARSALVSGVLAAPATPAELRAALDLVLLARPLAAGEPGLTATLRVQEQELLGRLAALTAPVEQPSAPVLAPPTPQPAPTVARPTVPTRTPVPPSFGVVQRRSFDGSGASGQFASCIDVQVLGPQGPVGGAVLGINNGQHNYQNQTDQNGYAGRCGLGASTWSVVLFWTPSGDVQGATTTVYVSGAPEQRAAVVFQAR
ncbi:MAG: hypothetical protein OHK0015_40120 [Chloroflexi bacterium OHK40]